MKNITLNLNEKDLENIQKVKNVLKNQNNENADSEAIQEALRFYTEDLPRIISKITVLTKSLHLAQQETENLKGFFKNHTTKLN